MSLSVCTSEPLMSSKISIYPFTHSILFLFIYSTHKSCFNETHTLSVFIFFKDESFVETMVSPALSLILMNSLLLLNKLESKPKDQREEKKTRWPLKYASLAIWPANRSTVSMYASTYCSKKVTVHIQKHILLFLLLNTSSQKGQVTHTQSLCVRCWLRG